MYSKAEIINALTEAEGYVAKAASIVGCCPSTVYDWRDRDDDVRNVWKSIREARHDNVEMKLHNAIELGNITAIIFYLKTQCKDRGYIERQEHTGKDGKDLNHTWEFITPESSEVEVERSVSKRTNGHK